MQACMKEVAPLATYIHCNVELFEMELEHKYMHS